MLKVMSFSLVAGFSLAVFACEGSKKAKDQPTLHVPETNQIKTPLLLAGTAPEGRDTKAFTSCFDGSTFACNEPYLTLQGTSSEQNIESILSATLVSDEWQINRFKNFLQGARPELISMFSCVKAVVISREVRPTHYKPIIDAIYLDALPFAVTKEESDTISTEEDARRKQINQSPQIIMIGDNHPTTAGKTELNRIQQVELLAHELAHACDGKAKALTGKFLSDSLPETPKDKAYSFAQRYWMGSKEAVAALAGVNPEEIGKDFEKSSILDIYGYLNRKENLAMLVQRQFSFQFEGTQSVQLIIDNTGKDATYESQLEQPIIWGMRGRLCNPLIFDLSTKIMAKTIPMAFTLPKTIADCSAKSFPAGTLVKDALDFTK